MKRHQRTLTFSLSLSLFPFLSLSPISHPPLTTCTEERTHEDISKRWLSISKPKGEPSPDFSRIVKICLWFYVTQVVCFAMQPRQTDTLIQSRQFWKIYKPEGLFLIKSGDGGETRADNSESSLAPETKSRKKLLRHISNPVSLLESPMNSFTLLSWETIGIRKKYMGKKWYQLYPLT